MRTVVLVSGGGSNLQALLDSCKIAKIVGVISNEPDAFALTRARRAGVPSEVLCHRDFPSREAYDEALVQRVETYDPGLVVLAGFMRILTPVFVKRFLGQILNIHPALLPAFRGLHTHARALAAGVQEHGASVHFVTEELDGGPVILQAKVPVFPGDTETTLAARVLTEEHKIYPRVVESFAGGRLRLGSIPSEC
ncbi:phosphoribosylglycinamide formyltransferase 1 [Gammaproteobacteria bacterium]